MAAYPSLNRRQRRVFEAVRDHLRSRQGSSGLREEILMVCEADEGLPDVDAALGPVQGRPDGRDVNRQDVA